MPRLFIVILSLLVSFTAKAQDGLTTYLQNKTFDGYHHQKQYAFKRYFSDYGAVYSTYPGTRIKRGIWSLDGNKLCIQWHYESKRDCYKTEISDDALKAFEILPNGTISTVFSLENPKPGNRLNKLSPAKVNSLNREMQAKSNARELQPASTAHATTPEKRISNYSLSVAAVTRVIEFHRSNASKNNASVFDTVISPNITFKTPYAYFTTKSRFGWYIEAGYSYYDLKDSCLFIFCSLGGGSTATGHYAYVAPSLFFSMSNPWLKSETAGAWKLGFGLGPAYLKGKAYFDKGTTSTEDDEYINYSAPGYIANLFIDYRIPYFLLRFRRSHSAYESDSDRYTIEDLAVETALIFSF